MDRMKGAALLTRLIEELRHKGSWCGETHIQKTAYFAQHLTGIPLGYAFILYKHGPFSFDLRDELTALRADELLKLEVQRPYGARMLPTKQSKYVQGLYPRTLGKYEGRIRFIADTFGGKGVVDLERLGTAFYVGLRRKDGALADERARRVTDLKPHISLLEAREAVEEIDRIAAEAKASFASLNADGASHGQNAEPSAAD